MRIIILIACLLGVLAFATPTNAQQTPKQFLVDLVGEARDLQDVQSDAAFLKLVRHNFDTQTMGKFVLGRYWKQASYEQRQRFLKAFELVSVQRFGPMLKDIPLDTFKIISVNDEDINNIIVVSTVYSKRKTSMIRIQWRLRVGYFPEYQVIDISAEGISLMLTLRAEYGSVIKQHGIESFISKLENNGI